MRLRGLVACAALIALSGREARAERAITIAIFAPNAPFESGTQRFAFVNRLAQQVTSVAGVQATPKAFARASDLESAIRKHEVDFAVIDGVYLAERGVPYQVLATATSGGETAPKWALFSSSVARIEDLQGKRLSIAAAGSRDVEFVSNALFDGELQVGKFFSGRTTAPDIASAVASVTFHKADAVFAPESQGRGLKKLFEVRERVPNAAFCQVASGLPSDMVSKVRSAVLGHGAAGPGLDGWKASGGEPYRALAARMASRAKRPVMVEPDPIHIEDQDVLVSPALEPGQPDLKALYWQPSAQ